MERYSFWLYFGQARVQVKVNLREPEASNLEDVWELNARSTWVGPANAGRRQCYFILWWISPKPLGKPPQSSPQKFNLGPWSKGWGSALPTPRRVVAFLGSYCVASWRFRNTVFTLDVHAWVSNEEGVQDVASHFPGQLPGTGQDKTFEVFQL